ncbi:MAG: hypothetical protein IJZ46_04870 [Bacilli bacterium]|nr:hypothetical protein [Bacilli bacterium]
MRKIGILANVREFIDKKKRTSALDRVFENIAFAEELELQELSDNDPNVISVEEVIYMDWSSKLIDKGYMAPNMEYVGGDHLPLDVVCLEAPKYVINECLDACKILWGKNIYTYSSSDYNDDYSSITVLCDNLSPENMDIISNYMLDHNNKYGVNVVRNGNYIEFKINAIGEHARIALIGFASMLTMQDVPEKEAYISVSSIDKDYAWYLENLKPGYVVDGDSNRIYINQFHYYKHMRYMDVSRVYDEEFKLKKTV